MPWVSDVRADIDRRSATLSSPAPRLALFFVAILAVIVLGVIATRMFGPEPYLLAAGLLAACATAALVACASSFRTRFDGDARQATVEKRSWCAHSVHSYPFAEIDALAVTEGCVVQLQLRNGAVERLSYAHETFPQLDKMISGLCAATGIAKGSPNLARAAYEDREGVLSERGMGLYVEGRFAILSTSVKLLSYPWVLEVVFNRERREMTVIRSTPFRRSRKLYPLQEVAAIGLDGAPDRETGAYAYRGVIRLQNGGNIALYGETPVYGRYDRILAKVRDLTGISKQDKILQPADHGARFRSSP